MYDVYFWTTPNGYKPLLMLEELGAEYDLKPIDISQNAQFASSFLDISPNNRIPAIVDKAPATDSAPISVFESGAILIYLAEKSGQFLPTSGAERVQVFEWLMWQMGGLGPMAGQAHHFLGQATTNNYAIARYTKECVRLYDVLDRRLARRAFLAGEYSIADMACYPWVWRHTRHLIDLNAYGNVKAWYERIAARPATARASDRGAAVNPTVGKLLV